nr:MAG TPA: protein of unknown function (DUF4917) [Caudoviricetes sp.]
MSRALIIVGNGLGMALDSNYFHLEAALHHAWNNTARFSVEHKRLVMSSLAGTSNADFPRSEDQLEKLQLAIIASDFLRKFESAVVRWLHDHARDLPGAFKAYIHEVAMYFHNYGGELPDAFCDPLAEFLRASNSHLAVLNYDDLLYNALIQREVLAGYNGALVDGFYRAGGFKAGNLDRLYGSRFGWYMHLHGSPLFIDNQKVMGAAERGAISPSDLTHIVLTHVNHKRAIIESSPILIEYWRRLGLALAESEQVFLFGYSGEDNHLNEGICQRAGDRRINIIEWSGAGPSFARRIFWTRKLPNCNIKIIPFDNILDFNGWAYELTH